MRLRLFVALLLGGFILSLAGCTGGSTNVGGGAPPKKASGTMGKKAGQAMSFDD